MMKTLVRGSAQTLALVLVSSSALSGQPVPDGPEFQVNIYTTSWQDRPTIAPRDGGYVISWQSRGQDGEFEGVYIRGYDNLGAPQNGEFQMNSYTLSSQGNPKIRVGPAGVVAVWRDGGFDGDAGSIMLKAPGQDDEVLVNTYTTGNHQSVDLAMDSQGAFVVVWENGDDQDGQYRGVFGQRFDAFGGFVSSEFQVNTTTTGSQDLPAVDGIGDGRFVVVWNADAGDDDQVMAQRFAADGSLQGGEITVNTPSYNRNDPDVAMAEDGSFVVVWKSYIGPTYEIYSRRFAANGNPTTGSLAVASNPGLGGYRPSVRRSPAGEYLVLWNDGAGDLRMRELGDDGVATSADAIVAQGFDAEVAFDAGGDSGLVTWVESNTDGDSQGVFARIIANPVFTDGFESGSTGAWSTTVP